MSLTAAQILDLAPDASSRKAGQDQAKPAKWAGLGRSGPVIWGEIKGSGAAPYRTVADLSGPASKCTCPSRKFPCKHALGLMLVDAAAPLPEAEPPDWVAAWAKGRASRSAAAETKAREPAKPIDEKAQARRRQAREERVAAALDELDLWLRDLMRRGLASVRGEPYAFWDRMAGRLVDGQAPGLARRVRALPGLVAAGARPGA
ncbi:SWIM zinc finger family protein, partial [Methylobacterium symbioticum]|uniref:SWIM zinc finger family protein n=2 Tax=Methylobacterium TaxID=407 RepID=UPI0011596932